MNNKQILIDEYSEFYAQYYNIKSNSISGIPLKKNLHNNTMEYMIKIKNYIKNKNCKILEYGCATGFNLRYLQNEGYKNLIGIDGYKQFIDVALTKEDNINYQYINFSKTNNKMTSFGPIKYDFIFTRGTLQQGETQNEKIKNTDDDVKSIFYNFYNMLSENGLVVICEGTVRNWIKLAEQANLTLLDGKNGNNILFEDIGDINLYVFEKI